MKQELKHLRVGFVVLNQNQRWGFCHGSREDLISLTVEGRNLCIGREKFWRQIVRRSREAISCTERVALPPIQNSNG